MIVTVKSLYQIELDEAMMDMRDGGVDDEDCADEIERHADGSWSFPVQDGTVELLMETLSCLFCCDVKMAVTGAHEYTVWSTDGESMCSDPDPIGTLRWLHDDGCFAKKSWKTGPLLG